MRNENYEQQLKEWEAVNDDRCPDCGADLDTGWECNGCGKDWFTVAQNGPPRKEIRILEPLAYA